LSEVSGLLDRFAAGGLPLGVLVADFIARHWAPDPPSAAGHVEQDLDDPALPSVGSWLEVEAAYMAGQIPESVYRVLCEAAGGRS
jgi:hypothetical protein